MKVLQKFVQGHLLRFLRLTEKPRLEIQHLNHITGNDKQNIKDDNLEELEVGFESKEEEGEESDIVLGKDVHEYPKPMKQKFIVGGAVDRNLSQYFRINKSLGSKDRAYIAETVYNYVRWKGLIETLSESNWQSKLATLQLFMPALKHHETTSYLEFIRRIQHSRNEKVRQSFQLPKHIQLSFPEFLYSLLKKEYPDRVDEICFALNTQAPTTIRTNTTLISRDELIKRLEEKGIGVSKTHISPVGINLTKRINLFSLEEFKEGMFEMQDEGSQFVGLLINPSSKQRILDYCSGSGGKILAVAPLMKGGQFYLHDVREQALKEARIRMKRAKIHNVQFIESSEIQKLNQLRGKMDCILLDVPCSGSGTLRRNPDQKWKINQEYLEKLVQKQREIFKASLPCLKPKGRLIYSTCSILQSENDDQVEFLLNNYPLKLEEIVRTWPTVGGMDGFFAAKFVHL